LITGGRLLVFAGIVAGCLLVPAAAVSKNDPRAVGAKPASPAAGAEAQASLLERQQAASALDRSLGRFGVVSLDPARGTPRHIARLDGFLTAPSERPARDVALDYVRAHGELFGLGTAEVDSLELSRSRTGSGLTRLHFTQSVAGIPAMEAGVTANVTADGRLVTIGGSPVPDLQVNTSEPAVPAARALELAAEAAGNEVANTPTATVPGPRRETRFGTHASARLSYLPTRGTARLVWRVSALGEIRSRSFLSVVDAVTGEVLRAKGLTRDVDALVYPNYPGAPVGGTQVTADITPYVSTPGARTLRGNFAYATSDLNGDAFYAAAEDVPPNSGVNYLYTRSPFTGPGCPSVGCSWDPSTPWSWDVNRKQAATQAFYWVNKFHDHLLAAPIEFTAAKGNFEGEDRVWIDVFATAAVNDGLPSETDNASMYTERDGVPPLLTLLLQTGPAVDSASEPSLVYHEYVHGLTNRLVVDADGFSTLEAAQGLALGEAWSDWYAMDYIAGLGHVTDTATPGEVLLGSHVDPTGREFRSQGLDCPVGSGPPQCPGSDGAGPGGYTLGDMGSVHDYPEAHADGEIWAETMWDLRRRLIADHGSVEGVRRTRLLATRALELVPNEPTFLDMRDAILQADTVQQAGADRAAIWAVFAARGMGYFASIGNAGDYFAQEDFTLPPSPGSPTGTIAGTVFSSTGQTLAGAEVWIGGRSSGLQDSFGAFTDAFGDYVIPNVPAGSYKRVYARALGHERRPFSNVVVNAGATTTLDVGLERNWASSWVGATVVSATGPTVCTPWNAIDDSNIWGWGTASPGSADHPGPKALVVELPEAVDVLAFRIDPTMSCGYPGMSSSLGSFRLETSRDGAEFVPSATDMFTLDDVGMAHLVLPAAGTNEGVRFVRLVALSAMNHAPGTSGATVLSFTELEVLGDAADAPSPPGTGFVTFRSTRNGGDSDIFVGRADGTGTPTDLTANAFGDEDPVSSPDGSRIAFASNRSGNWEIYVMDADGTDVQQVTNHPAVDEFPSWSPDGTRLAFDSTRSGNADIYTVSVAGGTPTRLTFDPATDAKPAWSPRGDEIAFQSDRTGNYELFLIPAAGGGLFQVTTTTAASIDLEPAWSPHGTRLAFTSNRSGNYEIYVANPDGSGATPVTNQATVDEFGSWSPDGSEIVFSSNRDGNYNLFRAPAGGGPATRLHAHAAADQDPSWLLAGAPDVLRPDTTITSGPSGTVASTSASFTFTATEAAAFECRLDGAAFSPCNTPKDYSGLAPGPHSFAVRARDAADNVDLSPATRVWTASPAPPDTAITAGPAGTTAATRLSFSFSSPSAETTGFECRLNGGAWTGCASPVTYGPLVPGAHSLEVRALAGTVPDPSPARRDLRVVRTFVTDLDGNAIANVAVWRPASGGWLVRNGATTYFGRSGDVPLPGDYDADPQVDLAVWRPATGGWYVHGSATVFHGAPGDVPVPGDYNGDAKLELAVWRATNGGWYVRGVGTFFFGSPGDVPLPGHYDADPELDLAVFRPSTGAWHVQGSPVVSHGAAGDVPVPADYDGDGRTDEAVWRPATGAWLVHEQATTFFGTAGDVPVPGQWDADAATDVAVWRPAAGGWYVLGQPTVFWGFPTDIP
jgi:Tol biopolymer transport system component